MEIVNIVKDVSEYLITSLLLSEITEGRSKDIIFRSGVFTLSRAIDEYWLKKKELPGFFETNEKNAMLTGYIFSLLFQIFFDALVSGSSIAQDIIDVSIVFAVNLGIEYAQKK
jgi:hypothetical protein